MNQKSVLLCILDGWGEGDHSINDIIFQNSPYFQKLKEDYGYTTLHASEEYVGLPKGQMGNSEVGHTTIGLGKIILQDLLKIEHAFTHKLIEKNHNVKNMIHFLKENENSCHVMGLLSPGGVHSHQMHLEEIVSFLLREGVLVKFHAFLDGRDTPPQSAIQFVENFYNKFKDHSLFSFSSLSGRYFSMDRDNRYDRTKKAYEAIVNGNALTFENPLDCIKKAYSNGFTDEFIEPHVLNGYKGFFENDAIWMGNFRADRVRQLLYSFLIDDFNDFDRSKKVKLSHALGFYYYSPLLKKSILKPIFDADNVSDSLGEIMSQHDLAQFRIAETEKYAHVTFFFNGGREQPFPREDRLLVPSPQVATYDMAPEMSAFLVLKGLKDAINKNIYSLYVANFANADMVGHTGKKDATEKAIQTLDLILKELSEICLDNEITLIITADHGNAEIMFDDKTHQPHTSHTLNKVPFVIVSQKKYGLDSSGGLQNIAPTILDIMNLKKPKNMTSESLIIDYR
jgi:2,3-bisphosphoglycerate-independent phosphoglycerate mutase